MSYYIGFRHGWVRVFGYGIRWADPHLYPCMSAGTPIHRIGRYVWQRL